MASPEQEAELSMSQLSLNSSETQSEDWDRSMSMDDSPVDAISPKTPRNSVVFPADGSEETPQGKGSGKRSLSELMRLHAAKGSGQFSAEEASRVADVLGQWINASSSPYEGEDDFFARSQDDMSVKSKKSPLDGVAEGRPRGRSESANATGSRSASTSNKS
ncbi:hypothetical protein BDZ89DRAFT_1015236 [Hymenopellis radicata]|nr:hypothetical protein BDZ89DRAFT_1015236 [Hymenopellis radicata]